MPGIGIGIPFRNISPLYDWMKIPFYAIDNIVLSALVGEEFVLYGDTLTNLPIKNNLSVIYTSDIGISSDNNYNLTPSISDIGEHTINVKFKNLGRLFLEKNITLRVVEKNPVGSRKILMIGDSLMLQGGQSYATEIKSILTNNTLTFVGTIGTTDKFEGYPGATWYSFITGGRGKFYKDGALNIPAYFTDYSIDTPDYVFIRLGVNDIFGFCNINTYPNEISDANITTILNNAKILIDAFLDFDSNLKIILGIPTISENTGAGWNNNYDESIYNQDLYIQNMHKYWITFLNTFANGIYNSRVDCSFEVFNLDRDNGFPKTGGVHTNGLHPNTTIGYPQLGGGMAIYFNKEITKSLLPTNLSVSFDIPSISGQVSWVDNSGGTAQYEVYSSYNGNPYVFLGTTLAGATSYIDTTCKQNASVVYRIRAKNGSVYSEYATTSVINTPLCWKTDQSTLTAVVITTLNIAAGKTVTVNWGDGTSYAYTGNNSNITKNYAETGQYNIWLSGDTDSIGRLLHYSQSKSYGVISNWILPSTISQFSVLGTQLSGDISGWILPSTVEYFYVRTTQVSGSLPQITEHATNAINYRAYSAYMSDSNVTVFRKAMTNFDVSNQNVTFSTANIDKFFKNAADWYQVNAPTANCTFNLSGTNMGIPTDGVSNVDIVRLSGYYTASGKSATILVRTS